MKALVAWPGNEDLAQKLSQRLGAPLLGLNTRRFPDGESYVQVLGDASGKDIAVVVALDRPDEKTNGLLFLADALRDAGARSVGLVAPYLAYLRQDARFRDGESVSSRTYARMLSRAFNWLVTVDPHLHRYGSLAEIYEVPATVVHAAPAIAAWVANNVQAPVMIGPDSESAQWVADIAAKVGAPWLVLEKTRRGDLEVEVTLPDSAKVAGRAPVLADDILSSGRTIAAAANKLKSLGAGEVTCIGVHAILAGNAHQAMLTAGVARIVTCNTIAHPTNGIDLCDLLAAGLSRHLP